MALAFGPNTVNEDPIMSGATREDKYLHMKANSGGHAPSNSAILAALFSLGAAAIHLLVAPEHFVEWWGYGVFFIIVTIFQGVYAIRLMVGRARLFRSRWYLLVGVLANGFVIALYVVTRTLGIPFFGPLAGEVEHIGLLGMASKLLELAVIALLAKLLIETWSHEPQGRVAR
jgi:hypothetical protein